MADEQHVDRAARALIAARDRLGAHADGDPPATIALLEGAIVAAVQRRRRRQIVLSCFATGVATTVAMASTLWVRGLQTSPAAPDETATVSWSPTNRPSPIAPDPPPYPQPAPATVPTARVSTTPHAARPARHPAPTTPPESGGSSTLAIENDLFAAALRAEHGGDRPAALRILDQLIRLYPESPLRESAAAERLKLLGSPR